MTTQTKTFLYAEFQVSIPFDDFAWMEANSAMQQIPGLVNKTWLSGISTNSIGGFYQFDTEENARSYAEGLLADFAKSASASLTVRLFDGSVVLEASRGMNSPYYGANA